MHTRRDILSLSSLIAPHEIAIKDFKNERAKVVRIYRRYRMALYIRPAGLNEFRRCIPSSFWYKTSIILPDCQHAPTILSKPAHTYIMASSSFILLRTSNPPTFHSPLSLVYSEPTRSAPWTEEASSLMNLIVCYQKMC